LRDGDFVYAMMNGGSVTAIYPVQISRELYEKPPWDCTYPSIRPADNIDNLSPADRVFGWVNQKKSGKGAWKGKVRISDSTSVQPLTFEPIPLAILGNPKPSQVRFYLGDQNGDPQRDGISKSDAAYSNNKKLRGRKIYLHQLQQDPNYWTPEYWLHNFAEYYMQIAPQQNETEKDRRSGQNRSISSWIPIDSEFRFTIKVENLTKEELGALLTLLTLTTENTERCFKLGYAKPLGFGSVTLNLDMSANGILEVHTGEEKKNRYMSFGEALAESGLNAIKRRALINSYKESIVNTYGTPPNPPSMPDIPASWETCPHVNEIFSVLTDEEHKRFGEVWKASLENNADKVALYAESIQDQLLSDIKDVCGEERFDELNRAYQQDIAIYRDNIDRLQQTVSSRFDTAWRVISFITDFLNSMKWYSDVHYPRNNPTDKGYVWFAGNEKEQNKAPVYGYSLPHIGQLLNETP
jgi:hypothetical protein